jgi:high-affinity K+ transport system ATPase subunit B
MNAETLTFYKNLVLTAIKDSFIKQSPTKQVKNPDTHYVLIESVITTLIPFTQFTGFKVENYIIWNSLKIIFLIITDVF